MGLTNLGATCYMASCMQHLYMMPQARASILGASTEHSKHEPTLKELQRMFAYLLVCPNIMTFDKFCCVFSDRSRNDKIF